MTLDHDLVIVGGGVAGLSAAIKASINGLSVLVIEKHEYPKHKVCGEYVSKEILPILNHFGIDVFSEGAIEIEFLEVTLKEGSKLNETKLPLGGFGLSRYALDSLLYYKAKEKGVEFLFDEVLSILFEKERFTIKTKTKQFHTKHCIGSFGKRSNLDKILNRPFSKNKTPWIGIKAHYKLADFDSSKVQLHHFEGGYAGISSVEDGAVNCCYLCNADNFKKFKNIKDFEEKILYQNLRLKDFFNNAKPIFDFPLSIAQISFERKKLVSEHIIFCGDAAGLIHPLCGNGIAMAIQSGYLAACIISEHPCKSKNDRDRLEKIYTYQWEKQFSRRLWAGRKLQGILLNPMMNKVLLPVLNNYPKLRSKMIQTTHGKPIFNQ